MKNRDLHGLITIKGFDSGMDLVSQGAIRVML